jgi:imidazole glycerol-phosphate synthase subunit HisH
MSTKEVIVVDYGLNNLLSVQRALEHCGARVITTKDHDTILNASYLVLPGVGAYGHAMQVLNDLGLVDVIRDVAARGVRFLGICLGMQLLLTESEEFGLTSGLNLIPGRVVALPKISSPDIAQKVPHVGWNELLPFNQEARWHGTCCEELREGLSVYFVHSFMAKLEDEKDNIAVCMYGDQRVAAVVARNNVMGCQFHPEKSGKVGLSILKNFLMI